MDSIIIFEGFGNMQKSLHKRITVLRVVESWKWDKTGHDFSLPNLKSQLAKKNEKLKKQNKTKQNTTSSYIHARSPNRVIGHGTTLKFSLSIRNI